MRLSESITCSSTPTARRPEAAPDDGAAAERVAGRRVEEVDARRDHAVDRVGNRDVREPVGRGPAPVPPLEHALLDEHVQHLLEEERVALGVRQHAVPHLLRHLASPRSEETSSAASAGASGVSESVVAFCFPAPQVGRVLEQLQPGRADEQDARAGEPLGQALDQVEQRARSPVDVLHGDDRDLLAAERLDVARPAVLAGGARPREDRCPCTGVPGSENPIVQAAASSDALGVLGGDDRLDRRSQLGERGLGRIVVEDRRRASSPPRRAASR